MRPSKSSTISRHSRHQTSFTFFIPSFFVRLGIRFFAPTHECWRSAGAGTVKAGRRSALASRSIVSRPRLDRPEHGGTLVVVGMTDPRGARYRGTRNSCRNLVSGRSIRPDHDASMSIGGEAPRRRDPFYEPVSIPWLASGDRHLGLSSDADDVQFVGPKPCLVRVLLFTLPAIRRQPEPRQWSPGATSN
jgi:hypothetical protein